MAEEHTFWIGTTCDTRHPIIHSLPPPLSVFHPTYRNDDFTQAESVLRVALISQPILADGAKSDPQGLIILGH